MLCRCDAWPLASARFFSRIIIANAIAKIWRKTKVIAIQKPGKDPRLVDSYRPVSLLSTCYKLLERLVLHRASHVEKLLSSEQAGFRRNHSTCKHVGLKMKGAPLFQHWFSMTFPWPKSENPWPISISKRYTTYECIPELVVTVPSARSTIVKKIKRFIIWLYKWSRVTFTEFLSVVVKIPWHYHHFPWPLLSSLTFQAWKMVSLNSMTFRSQGAPWKWVSTATENSPKNWTMAAPRN